MELAQAQVKGPWVMSLAVADSNFVGQAVSTDWGAVQLAQLAHDEMYHREITRLPLQNRITHMTLHFAKYAGRFHEDISDDEFKKAAVDCLIIGVTSANVLNLDLAAGVAATRQGGRSRAAFIQRLSIASGRMAAASEKLDHLEDFPFRTVFATETQNILGACIDLFGAEGWHPEIEINKRLPQVKAKAFFHGKV